MNQIDENDDDRFTARLVAYDEALAKGNAQGDETEEDTDPAWNDDAKLRGAKAVLHQLEVMWPRLQHPSDATRISTDTLPDAMPSQFGRFRIDRVLGQGGGGIVYLAYDPNLQRKVALKVPRPESLFTPDARRRFVREAEYAAQLNHPNIVPIHEAGEVGGVCYLVSAYCDGSNLADWLRSRRVSPRNAAQIVAALADGVASMHASGILHRDIKPRNVVLDTHRAPTADEDLGFTPRLADFGLAKRETIHSEFGTISDGDMTRTGAIIGTPAYMAPEQAEGRLDRIAATTDVYALGVLLYELLTGRTPFAGNSDADTLRRIVSDEPVAMRRLRRDVPRDLDNICAKCLNKHPGHRYLSALELARDLRRFLNGEPVKARPVGFLAQSLRWTGRHPAAAVAIVSILALMLALPGLVWYDMRLTQVHQVAATQELYHFLFAVKERRLRKPEGWTWSNIDELQRAAKLNPSATELPLLRSEHVAAMTSVDLRRVRAIVPGFLALEAAFSPDGKWLALAEGVGKTPDPMRVLLVDPATGNVARTLYFPSYHKEWQQVAQRAESSRVLAFSPEGRWLALGTRSGHIHRWDLNDPQAEATSWKGHDVEVVRLAFLTETSQLCSLDKDGKLKTWQIRRGWRESTITALGSVDSMAVLLGSGILACQAKGQVMICNTQPFEVIEKWACTDELLAAAPDGQTLASYDPDLDSIQVRKTDSGVVKSRLPECFGTWPAFSMDGRLLAQVNRNSRKLNVWDLVNGNLILSTTVPKALNCVTFHPDGSLLAVPAEDQTFLYEVRRSKLEEVASVQSDHVVNLAFGQNDKTLWTVANPPKPWANLTPVTFKASQKTEVGLAWNVTGNPSSISLTKYPTAAHPRRDLLACATNQHIVYLDGPARQSYVLDSVQIVNDLCFDPSGTLWVADHHSLRRASTSPGSLRTIWQSNAADHEAGITLKSVVAGTKGVLVGKRSGTVLWFEQERLARSWEVCECEVQSLALSQDEEYALVGTEVGTVHLLRLPSGDEVARFAEHRDSVRGVAFLRPDVVASASRDGTIRIFRIDGTALVNLEVSGPILKMQTSADGSKLAVVVEGERAARIWHLDQLNDELARIGLTLPQDLGRNRSHHYPDHAEDLAAHHKAGIKPRQGPLGLTAEIFATSFFQGKIKERYDEQVNLVAPTETPDPTLPPMSYSIRWSGWIKAPQPGEYRFWLYHDHSVRLYVDGKLVLDCWEGETSGLHRSLERVRLDDRPHNLIIAYRNLVDRNPDVCRLYWAHAGGANDTPELVPADVLYHVRSAAEKSVKPPGPPVPADVIVEPPTDSHGLKTELFAISRFHGMQIKIKERYDTQVDFGPTNGSPDPAMVSDWFSIRWSGWLQVPRTGRYTFHLDFDDDARFSLDGKVLGQWATPQRNQQVVVDLEVGPHALEILFWERPLNARCKLYWIPPGSTEKELVPRNILFHAKPNASTSSGSLHPVWHRISRISIN